MANSEDAIVTEIRNMHEDLAQVLNSTWSELSRTKLGDRGACAGAGCRLAVQEGLTQSEVRVPLAGAYSNPAVQEQTARLHQLLS
jgi:hypothetical protein